MIDALTIAALAVIGAIAAYFYGLRRAGQRQAEAEADAYQKTMEAINAVTPAPDADYARSSLRARLATRPLHGIGIADE